LKTVGAGTLLNKRSTEDELTDGTEDDFFDAMDSAPMKSVPVQDTATAAADENEFVIIEHPKSNTTTEGPAVATQTEQQSATPLTEKVQVKPASTKISNQPILEYYSAPFGTDQQKQEDEEPVIVSSLSGSEHSSNSTRIMKQKKPPAPPPQQKSCSNNEFDSIFGVSTLPAAFTRGFDTDDDDFFTNNGETSKQEQVTPTAISAEKAVPSASTPFEAKPEQTEFDNAFNDGRSKVDDNHETPNYGFQDSFHSSSFVAKGETIGVNENTRGVDETPIVKKEESSQSLDYTDKKHKKKKNIVSWAKSFGGFDSDKKKNKKKKSDKKNQHQPSEHPIAETSRPVSTRSVSIHNPIIEDRPPPTRSNNENSAFNYDISTIQGSHIAELVSMGFEPAAALAALDRYDQDLEKATNFLLDHAYQ
jgi:hypothetical protein